MKTFRTALSRALIASAFSTMAFSSSAADVPAGTVLSAANIEQLKGQTFEGKTIGSMLTEKMEYRIRESGWKLTLTHSKELDLDPRWIKATAANIGKTKINEQTCTVDGWGAGMPFPDFDEKAPDAGKKIIWNLSLGQLVGDVSEVPYFAQLLIDGKSGIHAEALMEFSRFNMKGRLTGDSTVLGNGDESVRQVLFFKAPSDVKGLGTYTQMYDSARVSDVWAYVPAVRRVRRLSGGAWMDPIGSSDQLQDDLDGWNARPCWYPEYKYLGRRTILAVANSNTDLLNKDGSSTKDKYPALDTEAPYWNVANNYEPREVYVVEAITPPQHPYGKKVLYIDTKFPRVFYAETYDRKGDFWKFIEMQVYNNPKDGDIRTAAGLVIDFQRKHATISLINSSTWRTNFDAKPSDYSLSRLQAAGR